MEKLKMETKDLVQENIEKLAKIFPGVITEVRDEQGNLTRAVDFELLKQELSDRVVEMDKERYQLTWPGKKEAMLIANLPINKTLRPVKEESVDWDNTGNIYIEGDNLDVLKILQESYLNKVKCIYIDPPYNTGKDFIYKDNFKQSREEYLADSGQVDEDGNRLFQNTEYNGRFHSDWLSMMYPRLKLARNLLREDGVIFISIDDNEVHNLRKICDEVFGERNFIGQITVVGNPRGRDYGGIARMHDYLLVYAKSEYYEINRLKNKEKKFDMFDSIGGFELRELRNRNIKFNVNNRPNLFYPFYVNVNSVDDNELYEISLTKKDGWIEVYPAESQGIKTVWRWGRVKSKQNLNINIKARMMRSGKFQIVEKYRKDKVMARSVWWDKKTNTEKGTLLLKELLHNKVYDYPKPLEMLFQICEMGSNKDSLILDFFSGSATTAHAVMQLNAEDGGNRRYIMVQLPEPCDEDSEAYKAGFKNISEIGKERIRRAARKIKEETGAEIDYGFRVFKVDSSNMKDVYYRPGELLQKDLYSTLSNIKEDRTGDDLLVQVMLEWGLEPSLPMEKRNILDKEVYFVAGNSLVACFDEGVSEGLVKEIAKEKPLRVVFRDSSFADDAARINVEELFKMLSPTTEIKVI